MVTGSIVGVAVGVELGTGSVIVAVVASGAIVGGPAAGALQANKASASTPAANMIGLDVHLRRRQLFVTVDCFLTMILSLMRITVYQPKSLFEP